MENANRFEKNIGLMDQRLANDTVTGLCTGVEATDIMSNYFGRFFDRQFADLRSAQRRQLEEFEPIIGIAELLSTVYSGPIFARLTNS